MRRYQVPERLKKTLDVLPDQKVKITPERSDGAEVVVPAVQ